MEIPGIFVTVMEVSVGTAEIQIALPESGIGYTVLDSDRGDFKQGRPCFLLFAHAAEGFYIAYMDETVDMTVAVRIPGWCSGKAEIKINGKELEQMELEKGYAYIERKWKAGDKIELLFPMDVVKMEGNPRIVEDAGRIALMRGPLVYCLEGQDNEAPLFDLTLGMRDEEFCLERREVLGYSLVFIKGKGMAREEKEWKDALYRPVGKDRKDWKEVEFTAIPYFAWANRGVNDMTVWIRNMV